MNEKSVSILVFISFGLIAFPFAVLSHFHLYADGAYFFARLVESAHVSAAGPSASRFIGHIITQYPVLIALKAGIFDISSLSFIYGALLYYMPFTCYVIAVYLLYRKGMTTHATLLVLMYTLLVYFTSCFIISESHLSTGLFILNISIIATCDLRKFVTLIVLMCLGAIGIACYEFWAIFFPVCLVFFSLRVREHKCPFAIKLAHALIIALYIIGFYLNTSGIINFDSPSNRDAMFSDQMFHVLPFLLAACLFFGLTVLSACFDSTFASHLNLGMRFNDSRIVSYLQQPKTIFYMVAFSIFAASVLLFFLNIPSPSSTYALRSLNLLLPLLFAASFLLLRGKNTPNSTSARTIAFFCVLPVLLVTMQANLYRTKSWLNFKKSISILTQEHSGLVSIDDLPIFDRTFMWAWTLPTLSIIVQTMEGNNVKSILYNPTAHWQPYGPSELENAASLTRIMHKNFVVSKLEI